MKRLQAGRESGRGWLAGVGVLTMSLALALSGCDDLLKVTDPDRIDTRSLDSPDAIPILVASAIGEFGVAYSGTGSDSYISTTAIFTDEIMVIAPFAGGGPRTRTDQRNWLPVAAGNAPDLTYRSLHQARRAALLAQQQIVKFTGGRDADWALMRALEAYTYVAFGEFFCGAVPFTELDETGAPLESTLAPLNTAAMFNAALARFDDAIAADGTLDMARIGKARVQLDLGQAGAAAATVAGVETTFIHFNEHTSAIRQENSLWGMFVSRGMTIPDREGINGLPWREPNGGIGDMRVPWLLDADPGLDGITIVYWSLKYRNSDANVVLADGVEARLIEAEAAHVAGDFAAALSILNALRADARSLLEARVQDYASLDTRWGYVYPPALAPLTDPGTDAARLDMIMSERGFWQWGTGHRQGDLRRLVVNYGRTADSVYPTGTYPRQDGGVYGTDVLSPLDFSEASNPLFDHSMCSTGSF